MTTADIIRILKETSIYLKEGFDEDQLKVVRFNQRTYDLGDLDEFKRDLIDAARRVNLLVFEYRLPPREIESFLNETKDPLVVFSTNALGIEVQLIVKDRSGTRQLLSGQEIDLANKQAGLVTDNGEVIALALIPNKEIVSDNQSGPIIPLSPGKRLLKLLATEKKDIGYILTYALIIGLLSLALPLGLQTTVEFISGGVFFSSVYILIGLVILGVLATGVLQIVQISIVEQLQRRVFVKAALEFAYRIPRIRLEALSKSYAPELINRFFEIITIQNL
jgi:ABC-type bacteriocin/lantibiotic exporter with double-glycine peptidase domain